MVNPPSNNDADFYARAMASFNNQIMAAKNNAAAATEIESYAKSLVEDDLPKIDSAVKSYLSLVAARSAVASDIDVLSASSPASAVGAVQCTFATSAKTPMDANRCALICARTLLSTINSTIIPPDSIKVEVEGGSTTIPENEELKLGDNDGDSDEKKMKVQLENNATQILWNKLVQSTKSNTGDKAKQSKPSRVLGRDSLKVAYPFIQERFRRGIVASSSDNAKDTITPATNAGSKNNTLQSLSDEVLPPVMPPKGIEVDQWEAFYTEFGHLLSNACGNSNGADTSEESPVVYNDSALIWSNDKGSAELQSRRESRAQRASEALASVEGAKAAVASALGTSNGDIGKSIE